MTGPAVPGHARRLSAGSLQVGLSPGTHPGINTLRQEAPLLPQGRKTSLWLLSPAESDPLCDLERKSYPPGGDRPRRCLQGSVSPSASPCILENLSTPRLCPLPKWRVVLGGFRGCLHESRLLRLLNSCLFG